MKHLFKLSQLSDKTNMNTKNLAIVWSPNLLKPIETDPILMQYDMLQSITLQANITEFLISNTDILFNDEFSYVMCHSDVNSKIKTRLIKNLNFADILVFKRIL